MRSCTCSVKAFTNNPDPPEYWPKSGRAHAFIWHFRNNLTANICVCELSKQQLPVLPVQHTDSCLNWEFNLKPGVENRHAIPLISSSSSVSRNNLLEINQFRRQIKNQTYIVIPCTSMRGYDYNIFTFWTYSQLPPSEMRFAFFLEEDRRIHRWGLKFSWKSSCFHAPN